MQSLSTSAARRLALHAQGLARSWDLPAGRNGALAVVRRLGYVQIDTISVVERAHDHVIATRHGSYDKSMLLDLLTGRQVFEYWAHAAAYLPFEELRYYRARMRGCANGKPIEAYRAANRKLMGEVRRRIEQDGPLSVSDFEHRRGDRGAWWDWKPAKRALEVLFDMGELMVSRRDGFRRVYDLAERVIPEGTDLREPDAEETARHFARRALAVHGVASVRQVRKMFANRGAAGALRTMLAEGEVVEVRLPKLNDRYYALPESLDVVLPRASSRVRLLSPFDNLVIDRDRLFDLFGFHYRIECYTPAARRRYGYFTLPILWKGRLVGRLDPKAERREERLLIRSVILEPGVRNLEALAHALARELRRFAAFNRCGSILVERTEPAGFRASLAEALDS